MGATTDTTPEARDRIVDTRSEAEIRMDVRKGLGQLGWTCWDFEQGYRPDRCKECQAKIPGGTRVPLGTPDLYVMGYGVAAWVELKSASGRQSDHQKDRQSECVAAGIPYYLVRSATEAVEIMEGLKSKAAA